MEYTVLVQKNEGGFTVTVPALPGCQTEGATETEALDKIRAKIAETLSTIKAVTIDVETADALAHAWAPFAGIWKSDESFDDFLEEIEFERRSIDHTEDAV